MAHLEIWSGLGKLQEIQLFALSTATHVPPKLDWLSDGERQQAHALRRFQALEIGW
jgi:hypothetical protein